MPNHHILDSRIVQQKAYMTIDINGVFCYNVLIKRGKYLFNIQFLNEKINKKAEF